MCRVRTITVLSATERSSAASEHYSGTGAGCGLEMLSMAEWGNSRGPPKSHEDRTVPGWCRDRPVAPQPAGSTSTASSALMRRRLLSSWTNRSRHLASSIWRARTCEYSRAMAMIVPLGKTPGCTVGATTSTDNSATELHEMLKFPCRCRPACGSGTWLWALDIPAAWPSMAICGAGEQPRGTARRRIVSAVSSLVCGIVADRTGYCWGSGSSVPVRMPEPES